MPIFQTNITVNEISATKPKKKSMGSGIRVM
jgi:hypothetical protein